MSSFALVCTRTVVLRTVPAPCIRAGLRLWPAGSGWSVPRRAGLRLRNGRTLYAGVSCLGRPCLRQFPRCWAGLDCFNFRTSRREEGGLLRRQGPSHADWLLCIPCARPGNMTSVKSHEAIGCWVHFWPQYHAPCKNANAVRHKAIRVLLRGVPGCPWSSHDAIPTGFQ